jgi:hypothetical protein
VTFAAVLLLSVMTTTSSSAMTAPSTKTTTEARIPGGARVAVLALDGAADAPLRAGLVSALATSSPSSVRVLDDNTLRLRLRGPAGVPLDLSAVRTTLAEAEAAFQALEHERSVALLESAIERLVADRDFSVEKQAMLEQARLSCALRLVALAGPSETGKADSDNGRRARAHLVQVLRANPTFLLDPRRHPPKMRALLALATDDLKNAGWGSLRVMSAPAGAQVFVDGRLLGTTPLALHAALPVGRFRLWLEAEHDRSFARVIDVVAGTEVPVEVDVGFEGALHPEVLGLHPSRPFTAADWRRLAGLLDVDIIVVVGADVVGDDGSPGAVWGLVVDGSSGQVTRGARVDGVRSPPSSSLSASSSTKSPVADVVDGVAGVGARGSAVTRLSSLVVDGRGDEGFVAPAALVAAIPTLPRAEGATTTSMAGNSSWTPVAVAVGVGVGIAMALGVGAAVWWLRPTTETFSVSVVGVE